MRPKPSVDFKHLELAVDGLEGRIYIEGAQLVDTTEQARVCTKIDTLPAARDTAVDVRIIRGLLARNIASDFCIRGISNTKKSRVDPTLGRCQCSVGGGLFAGFPHQSCLQ